MKKTLFLAGCVLLGPGILLGQGMQQSVKKQLVKQAVQVEDAVRREVLKRAVLSYYQEAQNSRIIPTKPEELKSYIFPLNRFQQSGEKIHYYQVMRKFADIKKELDIHFFYARTQGENLHPSFLADMNYRINEVDEELAQVALFFHDKPLDSARRYLLEARKKLSPFFQHKIEPPAYLRRPDREFVLKEFFLYNREGFSPYLRESWFMKRRDYARGRFLALRIPPGLRIAFVNDFYPLRYFLYEWEEKNLFPPQTEISMYSGVKDFQRAYKQGKRFDLIITDLVMVDGGGYAIVTDLRRTDQTTTVIAMSSYAESEVRAKELYDLGFDGMISMRALGGMSAGKSEYLTILNALGNYYFWKEHYGWKR